jgi:cell division protein FtsL
LPGAGRTIPHRGASVRNDRGDLNTGALEGKPYRIVRHTLSTLRDDERGTTAEKQKIVPTRALHALRSSKRPAMVEFYTVKRIDNSRLVRRVEPVKLRNLYKTVALGGVLAAFCMFYVYQHFRCIDLSFQLEDLKAKQQQAQSLNSELRLEIATLRDPRRIDVIAQKQLGLKRPEAVQVREYANADGAEVAAVEYAPTNRSQ